MAFDGSYVYLYLQNIVNLLKGLRSGKFALHCIICSRILHTGGTILVCKTEIFEGGELDSTMKNHKLTFPYILYLFVHVRVLMAHMSGTHKDGCQQSHGSTSYNGNSVHGMEGAIPTFQHQQTISMDWTPEEQALLEEGLAKYGSESNIIRYAKIAVQLKNKTVRDVALRYRWMTKKENSKRRKEDLNATRKSKDKKEKFVDPLAKPSRLGAQPNLLHASGMINNNNGDSISYNGIDGVTRELLQQNSWAFEKISANLNTHQLGQHDSNNEEDASTSQIE
ncbi:unnamed protein product [Fraxinus pennsylvanica]|uniref:Myb-like domain-containing protein n=1 Tax=Fraxinus pennsylvanica TaxID=56036 RepID=A0AAD1ZWL7_9LAMI|nr:unnamed protein product [Fraxinus pennsylvanica]